MRTSFIGGGVMAEAILARALASGVLNADEVCVGEPVAARREALADAQGVGVCATGREAITGAGLVVLAVKPQHLGHVYQEVGGHLKPTQSVLSIVAGAPLAALSAGLKHQALVRVMPNTPAQVGAGVSVWTATAEVSAEARAAAAALLGCLGTAVEVADESYLDMATAISGSGPAYVFAFMEALTEAGVLLGMPREMARTLAVETVAGSGKLASESGESPALLRERVTSPGGTTAAALRVLEQMGMRSTIIEAAAAAHRRAQELGGPKGTGSEA
ncbi:MAG: pyrroline-5-carboxylate reductase [Chloroflexota bacterium]